MHLAFGQKAGEVLCIMRISFYNNVLGHIRAQARLFLSFFKGLVTHTFYYLYRVAPLPYTYICVCNMILKKYVFLEGNMM